ncbi:hypothetical protein [Natrinema thermotolerans]
MNHTKEDKIEWWIDKHGHDSYDVAHLVFENCTDDELEAYLYVLFDMLTEDEVVELVKKIEERKGDPDR